MTPAVLWSLAAALSLATALITMRFGLRYATPIEGAAIGLPSTTLALWCLAPFLLELDGFNLAAAGIFALVGLFFPALVTLLMYASNERMGPAISSSASGTTPLFALMGAVAFLGEALTAGNLAGTLCVVLGLLLLGWNKEATPRHWPLWAIALPLGAAAIRAFAQVLTKGGLALWPNPYAAGLIGYTVSTLVILGAARAQRPARPPDRRAIPWFVITGWCNGGGVFFTYAALNTGQVALVSPITATHPLFTLVLSFLFLRAERIALRVAAGAALTVAGVIVLLRG